MADTAAGEDQAASGAPSSGDGEVQDEVDKDLSAKSEQGVSMEELEEKRAQSIREHREIKDRGMATYHAECKALYAVEQEARVARLVAAKQEAFDANTHYYRAMGEGLRRRKELAAKRLKYIDRRENERDEHSRQAVIQGRKEIQKNPGQIGRGERTACYGKSDGERERAHSQRPEGREHGRRPAQAG
jgi:hypothetical protein